jgi:multiple sugar transport system substrate-binding protein
MMISDRKIVTFSFLLILILGVLAVPVTAQDGITLRVWRHQDDGFNTGDDAPATAYIEANPGVRITFESFDYPMYIQTLQTALPAGTEADILKLFGTWVCGYAEGGRLEPVPESVMSLAEAQEIYYAAPVTGFTCPNADGIPTLYGLPDRDLLFYDITLPHIYNAMLGIETIDEALQAIHDEANASL